MGGGEACGVFLFDDILGEGNVAAMIDAAASHDDGGVVAVVSNRGAGGGFVVVPL